MERLSRASSSERVGLQACHTGFAYWAVAAAVVSCLAIVGPANIELKNKMAAREVKQVSDIERVDLAIAALAARLEAMEKPSTRELLAYRWKELRDLVEYLTVVGQTDVLGNMIASMRTHKKAADDAIAAKCAEAEAKIEEKGDTKVSQTAQ